MLDAFKGASFGIGRNAGLGVFATAWSLIRNWNEFGLEGIRQRSQRRYRLGIANAKAGRLEQWPAGQHHQNPHEHSQTVSSAINAIATWAMVNRNLVVSRFSVTCREPYVLTVSHGFGIATAIELRASTRRFRSLHATFRPMSGFIPTGLRQWHAAFATRVGTRTLHLCRPISPVPNSVRPSAE
jgi:hypothetical protein